MITSITPDLPIIDSRDVIERIKGLQSQETLAPEETQELKDLLELADKCSSTPDWTYGETLIRSSYFVTYISELIEDCYEMPKELKSGDWPYRHMTLDYQAAANEAEADYIDVMFGGVEYLIRG